MKKRILLILSLIFSISVAVFAQTKTVTDTDLEKFRQKRLAAEKDYRENYEKLGFPSPQELKRRIAVEKQEMAELSERLRAERLEREKNILEARTNSLETQSYYLPSPNPQTYERNYFYGYSPYVYIPYGYYNPPKYRSNYNRQKRFRLTNQIPPIRPPKPIRPFRRSSKF